MVVYDNEKNPAADLLDKIVEDLFNTNVSQKPVATIFKLHSKPRSKKSFCYYGALEPKFDQEV